MLAAVADLLQGLGSSDVEGLLLGANHRVEPLAIVDHGLNHVADR